MWKINLHFRKQRLKRLIIFLYQINLWLYLLNLHFLKERLQSLLIFFINFWLLLFIFSNFHSTTLFLSSISLVLVSNFLFLRNLYMNLLYKSSTLHIPNQKWSLGWLPLSLSLMKSALLSKVLKVILEISHKIKSTSKNFHRFL